MQLDEELARFQSVATSPALLPMLSRSPKWLSAFLPLLQHANEDIAGRVVALLQEMTEMDEDISPQEYDGLFEFCEALLAGDVLALLLEHLRRTEEGSEEGAETVFKALSIVENLLDIDAGLLETAPAGTWPEWKAFLVTRFHTGDAGPAQNRFYALELTAILARSLPAFRQAFLATPEAIDRTLAALAPFKVQGDPRSADEQEFFENLFDLLCDAILEPAGLEHFMGSRGIDLVLLLLKEMTMVRIRALRLLSFALTDRQTVSQTADAIIQSRGLKVLSPILMRKGSQSLRKAYPKYYSDVQDVEYIASVLAALLRFASQPAAVGRVEAKFEEGGGEKTDALLQLHAELHGREGALMALQQVDLLLALLKDRRLVGLAQAKAFKTISPQIKETLTAWAEGLAELAPEERDYLLHLCKALV